MNIRLAAKNDVNAIWILSRKLAEYEKALDGFTIDEDFFAEVFFDSPLNLECYLMEEGGEIIGMAQVGYNYALTGQYTMFFQDLIILKEHRGKGYGEKFVEFLVDLAKEKDCARVDFQVLDWNEPAVSLYKKMGGQILESNLVFRLPIQKA